MNMSHSPATDLLESVTELVLRFDLSPYRKQKVLFQYFQRACPCKFIRSSKLGLELGFQRSVRILYRCIWLYNTIIMDKDELQLL